MKKIILRLSMIAVLAIFCVLTSCKEKDDIFDRLRQNCVNYLTYGSRRAHDYNLQDSGIKFALQNMDEQVKRLWETMFPSPEIIWSNYPNNLNHGETSGALKNLAVLSMAFNQYGSAYYKNESLKNDLLSAMEWMYEYRYSPKLAADGAGDWYYKEIQCGLALGYNLMLLGDYLTDKQREKWLATYHAYNPNGYDFTEPWGATTAANRIDKCLVAIMAAISAKDAELLKYAIEGLDTEFAFAKGLYTGAVKHGIYDPNTLHDGFYPDGSFLQHVGVAHTGGYGTALLENLPFLFNIFDGIDRYRFPDSYSDMVCYWIKNSYNPVMFRGGVMDFVKDREIARRNLQTNMMGQRIASAICGLIDQMPEKDVNYIKSVVKGWITGNDYLDFFSYVHEENQRMSIGATIRMQKLIDDSSVEAITDFTMGRMFAVAARAVQFRPGYAFNVAMNSSRNKFYEAIRGEGKQHWYINEGMTCFYSDADPAQYDKGYWATVNLYRLPGTTVDTKNRADNEGNSQYGADWSGGVHLDDKYVAAGYQLSAFGVSLKAKKSYFMLEGKIACLGADISSTDGRIIETTIENRKYEGGCIINEGKGWLHYAAQSQGGFHFPISMNLKTLQEKRADSWSRQGGSSRIKEENDFFTLWIDHGKNPKNAEYQYVFLPNATAAETQEYALRPAVMILENSSAAQAVTDTEAKLTGINFWTDDRHTVEGPGFTVSCDKKASFMMIDDEKGLRIAVSDPTWKNDGEICFEIIFKTDRELSELISKDEGITVSETGKRIIFNVNTQTHLTQGKTFGLSFK